MEETEKQDDLRLDALLGAATTPDMPAGLADAVLNAIHRQGSVRAPRTPLYCRAWFYRSSAAVAACVAIGFFALWQNAPVPGTDAVVIDDAMVVDEVLDTICDDELVNAICYVSSADYLD